MTTSPRWILSIPILATVLASPAIAAHPHHSHASGAVNTLAPSTPSPATTQKPLTPAQQVALPDGGAPPPPHGYEEVEDSETALANYSATVRTHEPLGLPGPNAEQKTNGPNNLPSHFSIFGVPVIFNAPVTSPYYNEDTPATYAGHPSNGQTNILVNGDASPIH